MNQGKRSHLRASVVGFISLLWLLPLVGNAQTPVSCGTPGALQAAIDAAASGTTLLVSGACNENVVVREEKSSLVLDGQGTATISGPDPTAATVQVRSRGITIKRFTISGGSHGILVVRRGTVLIENNIIQGTGRNGVFVNQGSVARIIFNTIQNNAGDGIQVGENSSARVGFLSGADTTTSPNTIQGNGGRGITVTRYSNSRIVGNTINGNTGDGIRVFRVSHAEISANDIRSNGADGIVVGQNSGVNLGNDTGTGIFDLPNDSMANNSGFGIRCFINSYADGRLGTLNGNSGPTSFGSGCINSLFLADLAVTKVDSPDPVSVGSNLTYTITVTNNGPATATGVTLTDTLPAGVTFVSATSTQGSCTGTTAINCNIGTMNSGVSRTVTIVVTPTAAGGISNTASVAANEPDPNTANNTATAVTTVNAPSVDLVLAKGDSPDPIGIGSNLTYTLTAANSGSLTATGVVLTDTLPGGVSFVLATASQGSCAGTSTVTCNLGTLAAGGSANVTIVVSPTAAGTLTNTASVAANEAESNTANNTATAITTVSATPLSDVTPPTLAAFSFTPTAIDATAAAASVTVTMQITDDLSGAIQNACTLRFKSPSGAQFRDVCYNFISGTPQNGTWQGTVIFPQFSEPGTWVVEFLTLFDVTGNQVTFNTAALQARGFNTALSVTSVQDVSPPQLTGFSFAPTSIDTSTGAQQVTVTMQITDDLSGAIQNACTLRFKSPSGAQFRDVCYNFVSGTPQNGTWQGTVTFPQFSEAGTWVVEFLTLFDVVGNQVTFNTAALQAQGFRTELINSPGKWTPTGSMATARDSHTATLLANGKVLIPGFPVAELFDSSTGTFSPTGNGVFAHGQGATATRLLDGKVLIAGGFGAPTSAEIYDPSTGSSSATGSMNVPHNFHTATLLPDGRVLIAGGNGNADPSNTTATSTAVAELYNPATGTFTLTGSLNSPRTGAAAALLPDGRVLVAGGSPHNVITQGPSAELYDPATGTFSPTVGSTTMWGQILWWTGAPVLSNGKVLIVGGSTQSAELFDPLTGTFSATGSMAVARNANTATLLANGQVLVAGGVGATPFGSKTFSSAELYDPVSGTFTRTGDMNEARQQHTATFLPNGQVLVTGGDRIVGGSGVLLNSAELFTLGNSVQDLSPPQLVSFAFNPITIDTSVGAQQVTVTMQLTDNLSGAIQNACTLRFRSPSGGQFRDACYNFVSGTPQNGTWQGTVTFPQFSEAGTWFIEFLTLFDIVGNQVTFNTAALLSAGFNTDLVVVAPSLVVDGTVSAPEAGATVTDDVFGTRAQVVFPAGVLSTPTTVAIDVFQSPLDIPTPSGFSAPGTRFVNINLDPKPAMPLPAPGLTVVLPLANPMTPGTTLDLFRVDPATGNLVPAIGVDGQPVVGTVNADGLSATFNGVATLSIVVGLIPITPVANAGVDQTVNEGALVTLNGSASSGQNITFQWAQLAGPAVVLSGDTSATATFTAPVLPGGFGSQVLTFQLTVSGSSSSSTDAVDVTVVNVNHAPVAVAGGNQTVKEGSPVTLSGGNSFDPDGDSITFQWMQISGPAVALNGADTAQATFVAPVLTGGLGGPVILGFALTVSDGALTGADEVTVTVEQENHAPTANAGADQTVFGGSVVSLDGSGSSDPDGDAVLFLWTQVGGPAVQLSDATAARPTFTAPSVTGPTMLTFRLVVNDTLAGSVPDDVVITVVRPNDPPLCNLARTVPDALWPPNHKLIPVSITGITDPNNDQVRITITQVTQDEPVNGLGDGDTSPDAVIQGSQVLLRAERSGQGNGRVYVVQFTADDGQGGVCNGSVSVGVPHSAKPGATAVDDGQLYDSTQP